MSGPDFSSIMRTLDALAHAARSGDVEAYRAALDDARFIDLTEEQIFDSYHWGRRGRGAHPDFDHHGEPRRHH